MIPREFIEEICDRCDIETVVGRYVTLKRAGSNLQGLCPFHSEKSPSFTVFPATKSFYCFGCGAGGDVITFIQKMENLDYVGAVEALATQAGIALPNDTAAYGNKTVNRRRIYEMNLEAAKFFRACLFDSVIGKEGMEYLAGKRQLSGAVIKHFGLGYAPNDFTMLTRHMKEKGYTEDELVAGFLAGRSQKNGRLFDMFRNRVMFPVIDTAGHIVAFGGRVLDDSKPKYLNSSDTPGFKKSRILYGLNYAKDAAAEEVILCEGYMDTIAMQAAGFTNAVATLGTAITPDHARLLSRYTKRVIINYDNDEAGMKAADKAMRLLDEVGLPVRVLKLQGAKDADEFIKKFGADGFRKMLRDSSTAFDFKMEKVLSEYDITGAEGKIRAARDLVAIIALTPSGVERELYQNAVSKRLGIAAESIANDVAIKRKRNLKAAREAERRDVRISVRQFGDKVNPDAAKDPGAAAAENEILGLLLLFSEHRRAVAEGKVPLSAEDFFTDFGKRAFTAILNLEEGEGGFDFSLLGETLNPDEMGRLVRLEEERRALKQNGKDVFEAAVAALSESRRKRSAKENGNVADELSRRRAELKKKKENR